MKILMVASEAVPYAKTGGLADVAGTLPSEMARAGHDVLLLLPYYKTIAERFGQKSGSVAPSGVPKSPAFGVDLETGAQSSEEGIRPAGVSIDVPLGDRKISADIYIDRRKGVRVAFLRHDPYFWRDALYQTGEGDYPDNAERFFFFSRAAFEAAKALGFQPDILHCHDWHAALAIVYLKTLYRDDPFFSHTLSVFTIHNLGYQGLFWHYDWPMTGLPWELFQHKALEFYGKINCLKGGIIFSDLLTTVSKRYTKEIQTVEYGCGLEGVLGERAADLYGILNGIDVEEWNPQTDRFIAARYSAEDPSGKAKCKEALQKETGLERSDVPLIANIGRLTVQKGVDLIVGGFERILSLGTQFLLLGSGDKAYEEKLLQFASLHPSRVHVRIAYDNAMAHRIEAGADIFLMPSRYEPCGLNQMMSLRYGTVPVVRATGGLDDTIRTFSAGRLTGNGFKFKPYEESAMLRSLADAVGVYRKEKLWRRLMQNGMGQDFSWERSAAAYLTLYRKGLAKKGIRAR